MNSACLHFKLAFNFHIILTLHCDKSVRAKSEMMNVEFGF